VRFEKRISFNFEIFLKIKHKMSYKRCAQCKQLLSLHDPDNLGKFRKWAMKDDHPDKDGALDVLQEVSDCIEQFYKDGMCSDYEEEDYVNSSEGDYTDDEEEYEYSGSITDEEDEVYLETSTHHQISVDGKHHSESKTTKVHKKDGQATGHVQRFEDGDIIDERDLSDEEIEILLCEAQLPNGNLCPREAINMVEQRGGEPRFYCPKHINAHR
jgi:hypothetical protein